jgi:hypothetical protein
MGKLWIVTVTRDSVQGTVKKGMFVEIQIQGGTREPTMDEIANALNQKYNCRANSGTLSKTMLSIT